MTTPAPVAKSGVVWASPSRKPAKRRARWLRRFQRSGATLYAGSRVIGNGPLAKSILVEDRDGARVVRYRRLILATGARELFLPFPGWTLPNVFGVGGIQALGKIRLAR